MTMLSATEFLKPPKQLRVGKRTSPLDLQERRRAGVRSRSHNAQRTSSDWRAWYAIPENRRSAIMRAQKWAKENRERYRLRQRLYQRRRRLKAKLAAQQRSAGT